MDRQGTTTRTTPDHIRWWDVEIDAFDHDLAAVESALDTGVWSQAPTWTPPERLEGTRPTPAQGRRIVELLERLDALRPRLTEEIARVEATLGDSRRMRTAARHYATSESIRRAGT